MSAASCRWFRLVLSLSLIVVGCFCLPVARPAQAQSTDLIVTIDEVDTSAFPTIQVRTSIRSRNGVPIQDLTADHFELIEDGASAARPDSVTAESNARSQVSLAIVIDTYETLEGAPIEAAQQATNDLLADLLDETDDPDRAAFVAVHRGVSTDPQTIDADYEVAFTNDRNLLLNVINFLNERIETTGAGTPLYDAVVKAVRMTAATEPVGHRAVIVMTDGDDRDSISTDGDSIQTALNERTPVFTVGLSNSRLDEQFLMRLADQTGGTYQAAETPEDFSPLFNNVLTMLRTQYVLTYESGLPEDGQPHSVLLHVRTPTQLEAFQEQRIETPGDSGGGGGEAQATAEPVAAEDATPTAVPPTPTPTPKPDMITTVRDFVQDNLVLTIVGIAAIALLFLILIVVIIVVVRRKRQGAQAGGPELELPPIPEAPAYAGSGGVTGPSASGVPAGPSLPVEGEWAGPTRRGGATGPAPSGMPSMPSPTAAAAGGPAPFSARPSVPPSGPPIAPPPFAVPVPAPAAPEAEATSVPSGGTQILDRTPKMAMVGLLIDRAHPEQRFDVSKRTITIGRGQGCDVVVDHPTVSRQHASIKLEGEHFRLYDLGSSNGTFLGDQRVREPQDLQDGAIVRFGGVEFIFKVVSLTS